MERYICRPIIILLLSLSVYNFALAGSFDPESFHFKKWKFRAFAENSFFRTASQGASGVFVNTVQNESAQVFMYSGKRPAKEKWTQQEWREQVFVPQKTEVAYLNEKFSDRYYTGQMNSKKNGQLVRVLVLSFRSGDEYTLFMATNNQSIDPSQDTEIRELFESLLKKQKFK